MINFRRLTYGNFNIKKTATIPGTANSRRKDYVAYR